MLGYYKNEAATKEAFTSDGFLKTGDIAEINSEGDFKITGRIKDLIITSGGKNISPQNIEGDLMYSPYIDYVALIGDGKNYVTALIVPAFDALEPWAKDNGISVANRSELVKHEKVKEFYAAQIKEQTKEYGQVEQIKKFTLLDNAWSQESGELTPTLKLKRRIILEKYKNLVDQMYKDA
jgi:long-chain acyl-CoA synthetase